MFLLLIGPSVAATFSVSSSGTYTTIQSAVDKAASGDTISVAAGTYSECVDLKGKDLTLTGAGAASTDISGSSCAAGALQIDGGEAASISGFTIDNGTEVGVVVSGGAIVDFDDIVVENSGATSTSGATTDGGGMSISGSSYVEISDSTFEDNTADYGGAIFIDASWLILDNVELSTNYGRYGGGAIRAEYGAEISLEGCTFSTNGTSLSSGKGGAISAYYEVIIEDDGSTFDENYAATYGGAITTEDSCELTLTNSVFTDNYVDRTFASPISGGAIYAEDNAAFDIDSSEFDGNTVYLYGAAIHCNGINAGKTMTIANSVFTDNVNQSKRGGAVEASAGVDLIVTDSTFDGNTASEAGGAISYYTLNDSQDLVISGSTFTDNTTTSTRDAHGGAVFVYNYNATVSVDISDSTFDGNTASLSGGGLYTSGADDVVVSNSEFTDNTASDIVTTTLGNYNGGAISIYDAADVALSSLTMCNNTGDDGGALYMETVSDFVVTNTIIADNTASSTGGGIYFYDATGEITNNNILGGDASTGGGGVYLDSSSSVDFTNNVFAYTVGGDAAEAGDTASASGSSFSYNDWYSNTSSDTAGYFSFSTSANGNITDAPDFKTYSADGNCGNDDFILSSTSALIDAGDPTITDADGSDSDIGAYGGPGSPVVDVDGDGHYSVDDCDDNDDTVYPGATEACDGLDNDCDGDIDEGAAGLATYYADNDGDGLGDPDDSVEACSQPSGYVTDSSDCDDDDSSTSGSAGSTFYSDVDGDGYGSTFATTTACDPPSGYVDNTDDCDDSDSGTYPGADEYCDGDDNDCDGDTDEDSAVDGTTWYADIDGDGYGVSTFTKTACDQPSSYAATDDDCDDADSAINPGAAEVCDSADNDCDGSIDNDATDATTYYDDGDSDGYGDPDDSELSCASVSGAVTNDEDCDDTDSAINPGATEACDGDDNDCDGDTDEAGATGESTWYVDADGDDYGVPGSTTDACDQPAGYAATDDDCDDGASGVNPGAAEVCDGIDNNCDGDVDETSSSDAATWYEDSDEDGYGDAGSATVACEAPSGYTSDASDCDDSDNAQYPGADEYCNGEDDNCDGDTDEDSAVDADTWYDDADSDGYGDPAAASISCAAASGAVADGTDCDDDDAAINPGADEICDEVDNDCDNDIDEDAIDASAWYTDADDDGYGDPASVVYECDQPAGTISDGSDCDDTDDRANPDGSEIAYDGIDNDCVDGDLVDVDEDGFDADTVGGPDCDDNDAATYPGAPEVDGDGVDQDCDGSDQGGIDSGTDDGKNGCSTTGGAGSRLGVFGLMLLGFAATRRRR